MPSQRFTHVMETYITPSGSIHNVKFLTFTVIQCALLMNAKVQREYCVEQRSYETLSFVFIIGAQILHGNSHHKVNEIMWVNKVLKKKVLEKFGNI